MERNPTLYLAEIVEAEGADRYALAYRPWPESYGGFLAAYVSKEYLAGVLTGFALSDVAPRTINGLTPIVEASFRSETDDGILPLRGNLRSIPHDQMENILALTMPTTFDHLLDRDPLS